MLILCATSAGLALSAPVLDNAQTPLLPTPLPDKALSASVVLAITETGRDREYPVEIPLGARASTGMYLRLTGYSGCY